jgi:hypothetical protein
VRVCVCVCVGGCGCGCVCVCVCDCVCVCGCGWVVVVACLCGLYSRHVTRGSHSIVLLQNCCRVGRVPLLVRTCLIDERASQSPTISSCSHNVAGLLVLSHVWRYPRPIHVHHALALRGQASEGTQQAAAVRRRGEARSRGVAQLVFFHRPSRCTPVCRPTTTEFHRITAAATTT